MKLKSCLQTVCYNLTILKAGEVKKKFTMLVFRRLFASQVKAQKFGKSKRGADLGIAKQKELFDIESYDIDNVEGTDFEEFESDFMEVHKSHRDHLEELKTRKEREKFLIVKQKYFKQYLPNFLTWHDIEQIRYLYNNNPEEWNIDRLTEGFPATADVIRKIVQSKWSKKNENRIRNHDKVVLQNWKDFKEGKLDNLPDEVKEHLQKFSNRSFNFETHAKELAAKTEIRKLPANGEFSEIINSYHRMQESRKEIPDFKQIEPAVDETKGKKNMRNSGVMTFKDLQTQVQTKVFDGSDISHEEKLLKNASYPRKEDMKTIGLLQGDVAAIVQKRHETNTDGQVGFVAKTTKDLSNLVYPERITIPKSIYKRGYTFKLNDCYYDCNGEFLYRVPGMT